MSNPVLKDRATIARAFPSPLGPVGVPPMPIPNPPQQPPSRPASNPLQTGIVPRFGNALKAFAGAFINPGVPMAPTPEAQEQGPRAFQYASGSNINLTPRASEGLTPFSWMVNIAELYDTLNMAILYRQEEMSALDWQIVPRNQQKPPSDAQLSEARDRFERPDGNGGQGKHRTNQWLSAAMWDVLVTDALSIFINRSKGGSVLSWDLLDGACYSADTEVLTKQGWKNFADVQVGPNGDQFATRNQQTHAFEWQNAFYYHKVPFSGNMVSFTSKALDILVSPNHRMLLTSQPRTLGDRSHGGAGECFVKAGIVAETHTTGYTKIPAVSHWDAPDVERFRLAPTNGHAQGVDWAFDDFAAFMGMYLSEGCVTATGTPKRDAIYITQKASSKGFTAYQELLRRLLGREVGYTGQSFHFRNQELATYLRQFGKALDKYVPDLLLESSSRQLRIFWDYYMLGDGTYSIAGKRGAKAGRQRVSTSSMRMADDLQEIVQKLGGSASISTKRATKDITWTDGRTTPVANIHDHYVLNFRTSPAYAFTTQAVAYTGDIYCVSVPNEVLYVRRNGTPAWCGNTVKPLLTASGRTPLAPLPAYQQILYGRPVWEGTTNDLMYAPKNIRAKSAYGRSPVEMLILTINRALRRQSFDLNYYAQGNIPEALVPAPAEWSQDQIEKMQNWFDTIVTMPENRRKLHFIPSQRGNLNVFQFKEPILDTKVEEFLDKRVMAMIGVPPMALGMTNQVNKSSSGSQENTGQARLLPYLRFLSGVVSDLFLLSGLPDCMLQFAGERPDEDKLNQAQIDAIYLEKGVISTEDVQSRIGVQSQGQRYTYLAAGVVPFPPSPAAVAAQTTPPTPTAPTPADPASADLTDQAKPSTAAGKPDNVTLAPGENGSSAGGDNEGPGGHVATPASSDVGSKTQAKTTSRSLPSDVLSLTRAQTNPEADDAMPSNLPVHTGIMIALHPDQATAERLALPEGEAPEELHITLAYLGEAAELSQSQRAELPAVVARLTATMTPFSAVVTGLASFPVGSHSNGLVPVYAQVELPDHVLAQRAQLVAGLLAENYPVATNFPGFTPHITLLYADPNALPDMDELASLYSNLPLAFSAVYVHIAGVVSEISLPQAVQRDVVQAQALNELKQWQRHLRHAGLKRRRFVTRFIPQELADAVQELLLDYAGDETAQRIVFAEARTSLLRDFTS